MLAWGSPWMAFTHIIGDWFSVAAFRSGRP